MLWGFVDNSLHFVFYTLSCFEKTLAFLTQHQLLYFGQISK